MLKKRLPLILGILVGIIAYDPTLAGVFERPQNKSDFILRNLFSLFIICYINMCVFIYTKKIRQNFALILCYNYHARFLHVTI